MSFGYPTRNDFFARATSLARAATNTLFGSNTSRTKRTTLREPMTSTVATPSVLAETNTDVTKKKKKKKKAVTTTTPSSTTTVTRTPPSGVSYAAHYEKDGSHTVWENGLVKKYDTKNNLISVEPEKGLIDEKKLDHPTTTVHHPDGSKTVHEKGLINTYSDKGNLTSSRVNPLYAAQKKEAPKETSTAPYTSRSYDYRNGYGGYGGYGDYYGDGYPAYDPTKPYQERQKEIEAWRAEQDLKRKKERRRKRKDSPTILADLARELKIDNKDKVLSEDVKAHKTWQAYLDYIRGERVPGVKQKILDFNLKLNRNILRLCDGCAGSLLIPNRDATGLICGAEDCLSCNGRGFQIPMIEVA